MIDARTGGIETLGVAIALGLVIAAMIATVGHISGAHLNPAVTVALWARRTLPLHLVAPHVVAQVVGGTAAALTVRASLGGIGDLGATTMFGGTGQAFVWEVILTAILVSVVLALATDTRASGQPAALIVGGTIALCAVVGGPVSGASMNHARSLAPAIAGGPTNALWVYLTAPILGAALAVGLFGILMSGRHDLEAVT
jgi:aquaporin NIP